MLRMPIAAAFAITLIAPLTSPLAGVASASQMHAHKYWGKTPTTTTNATSTMQDGFATLPVGSWADGTVHGNWLADYNGYGTTAIVDSGTSAILSEEPKTSTAPDETHAALVTSVPSFGDMSTTVRFVTVRQLRIGSSPNPWEVGWVLWHYTDDSHFYYILLKPNGFELGKEDPAYPGGQRFLVTGSAPTFAVGVPHTVTVTQVGDFIQVTADGHALVSYTDTESPYLTGHLGLYDEDAEVAFSSATVSPPA